MFSISVELMRRNNIIVSLIKISVLEFKNFSSKLLLEKCERKNSVKTTKDDFNTILAGFERLCKAKVFLKEYMALLKGCFSSLYQKIEKRFQVYSPALERKFGLEL